MLGLGFWGLRVPRFNGSRFLALERCLGLGKSRELGVWDLRVSGFAI